MEPTRVVTAFLRNGGKVLLVRRSDDGECPSGRWGTTTIAGAAGRAEDDLDRAATEAIGGEAGLDPGAITLVRAGDPFADDDQEGGRRRVVRPYLFEATTRDVAVSSETVEADWVSPTEIRRRETTSGLWRAYERVAPTLETIEADRERGSAALSVNGLRVLRDRAGVLADRTGSAGDGNGTHNNVEANEAGDDADDTGGTDNGARPNDDGEEWAELASLARDLRGARPEMVAIGNRVNRAMADIDERTPKGIERAAQRAIERAANADEDAATVAAEALATLSSPMDGANRERADDGTGGDGTPADTGPRLFTLSRSGTVIEALRRVDPVPEEIVIAASRPGGEGIAVGEELHTTFPVTLVADAGIAGALARSGRRIDAVLVGADTIYPDGGVLNKVGTRTAAIAAAHEGVPVYVVAASAKISPDMPANPDLEANDGEAIHDGDTDGDVGADIDAGADTGFNGDADAGAGADADADPSVGIEELNPTFDVTPGELVTGIYTENGELAPTEVATVAKEFATLAAWEDR
jgi:translation initiation factor 2B subunit (eIF-2B alpha/beta/delta family)